MKSTPLMWVALLLPLMAIGCATKPTEPQHALPVSKPALPVAAMVDLAPPPAPAPVAGLPPQEQARVLLRDYTDAMQWGAEADRLRRELIDWINRLHFDDKEPR